MAWHAQPPSWPCCPPPNKAHLESLMQQDLAAFPSDQQHMQHSRTHGTTRSVAAAPFMAHALKRALSQLACGVPTKNPNSPAGQACWSLTAEQPCSGSTLHAVSVSSCTSSRSSQISFLVAFEAQLLEAAECINSCYADVQQQLIGIGQHLPPTVSVPNSPGSTSSSIGGGIRAAAAAAAAQQQQYQQLQAGADAVASRLVDLDGYIISSTASLAHLAQKYDTMLAQGAGTARGTAAAPGAAAASSAALLPSGVCSHSSQSIEGSYTASVPADIYHQAIFKLLLQDNATTQQALLWGLGAVYARLRNTAEATADSSHTHPPPAPAAAQEWQAPDEFKRTTAKYWVHPTHVLRLKLLLLRHLPLLVFGAADPVANGDIGSPAGLTAGSEGLTPLISSLYFDNAAGDVYRTRLAREDGARLVRLRHYGTRQTDGPAAQQQTLFVECKTHRDKQTGELSVKERAALAQRDVASFLAGSLSSEATAHLSGKKVALLQEVHSYIKDWQQVPALRSEYFRTAWQRYNSNAVRLSLDEHLLLLRERGPDSQATGPDSHQVGQAGAAGGGLCAALEGQAGGVLPLSGSDAVCFPYVILEIKLQEEEPPWIVDLKESGLLVEARRFSKFLHGMALLYPDAAAESPSWFAWDKCSGCSLPMTIEDMAGQVADAGNRGGGMEVGSAGTAPAAASSAVCSGGGRAGGVQCYGSCGGNVAINVQQLAVGVEGDACLSVRAAAWPAAGAALHTVSGCDSTSSRYSNLISTAVPEKQSMLSSSCCGSLPPGDSSSRSSGSSSSRKYKAKLQQLQAAAGQKLGGWKLRGSRGVEASLPSAAASDQSGRNAHLLSFAGARRRAGGPVTTRIEPKTFFANERTFLAWLNVSVLVMLSGLGLLSGSVMLSPAAGPDSQAAGCMSNMGCVAARGSGAAISAMSVLFMGYALYLFRKRTKQILSRSTRRYDDQAGPVLLTVLLVLVTLVSLILAAHAFK